MGIKYWYEIQVLNDKYFWIFEYIVTKCIYFSFGKRKLKLKRLWRDMRKQDQNGKKLLKLCKRYCGAISILCTVTVFLACTT
jgi:hypothetical protein